MVCTTVWAQNTYLFSGTVQDTTGSPISYATLSIDQARYGALTDERGRFRIAIPRGNHQVRISHLGYKPLEVRINLTSSLQQTFRLQAESLVLEEVLITSDGRDPAYGIIQLAIDRKKQNSRPFDTYAYNAYTKTAIDFRKGFDPDSLLKLTLIFGNRRQKTEQEIPAELKEGLLFLSENYSRVHLRQPDRIKEEILRSKISGNSEQFSFFGNLFNQYTPYENLQKMGNVTPRGIVSPISDNAFLFYKYKLLGTLLEEGNKLYKIQITPKRNTDPVYMGYIYIADSSYAVAQVDLTSTSEQQLFILDTLRIQQSYIPIRNAWIPVQTQHGFAFSFNLLGVEIPFTGFTQSLLSDYEFELDLPNNFFNREVLSISDSALVHDSTYWEEIRPLALRAEEALDYQVKDSLETIRNSPAYLDSLTKAQGELRLSHILWQGKTFRNFRTKTSWQIQSLLTNAGFNPMEGFFVAPGVTRTWEGKQKQVFSLNAGLRYGFSSQKFGWKLEAEHRQVKGSASRWKVAVGRYPTEFSRFSQIRFGLNTLYALLGKQNYLRLYDRTFAEASYSSRILNGLRLSGNLRYEDRASLPLRSDYSFFNEGAVYDPNISIPNHQAFIAEIGLRFRPFNQYIRTPEGRINMGSSWPLIRVNYQRGIPLNSEQSADFERISISANNTQRLGLLGTSRWQVRAGRYLSTQNVFFPDVWHFKNNETFVRLDGFTEFGLVPYYAYSSTLPFIEGHWEHSFSGFLLNKIPGIKRLKLSEYLGVNYLIQEKQRAYLELYAGLEKRIFKFIPIRLDVFAGILQRTGSQDWGVKLTLVR